MPEQPAGPAAAAAAEAQGKAPPPVAAKPPAQTDAPPPAGENGAEPEAGAEGEAKGDKALQRQAQLTRQFAALSRREKQAGQREQQFKAQMEQERAALQAEMQQARQVLEARRRASDDPEAWLRAGGWDYDKLTDHYAKRGGGAGRQPSPAADDQWKREFERKWEEREKQHQEREQALLQERTEYAKRQDIDFITRFMKDGANTESYELINHFGAYSDVYEYMDLYRQEYGEVPDIQAAAERIEEILLERETEKTQRALGAKKLARRLGWTPQDKNQPGEGGTEAAAEASPETPPKQDLKPARGKQSKPSAPPASKRKTSSDDLSEDPDERWERMKRRAQRG